MVDKRSAFATMLCIRSGRGVLDAGLARVAGAAATPAREAPLERVQATLPLSAPRSSGNAENDCHARVWRGLQVDGPGAEAWQDYRLATVYQIIGLARL